MNAEDIRIQQEIEEALTRRIEQALDRAEAAEAAFFKGTAIRANDLRRLSALLEALYSADFERQDDDTLPRGAELRAGLQDLPHLLLVVQRAVEGSR